MRRYGAAPSRMRDGTAANALNALLERSRRPDDPALRERLRALSRERRRFGHHRLLIFPRREGFVVNHKRLSKSGYAL